MTYLKKKVSRSSKQFHKRRRERLCNFGITTRGKGSKSKNNGRKTDL